MPDITPSQVERAAKIGQLAAVLVDPTKTAAERENAKAAAKVLVAEGEDQAERDRLALIIVKAIKEGVPPAPAPPSPPLPPAQTDDEERIAARLALVKSYAAIISSGTSTPQERKDALAMAKLAVASGESQSERDALSAIVIAAVAQAAPAANQSTAEAALRLERERARKAAEEQKKKEEEKGGSSTLAVVGVGLVALVGGAFLLFRK